MTSNGGYKSLFTLLAFLSLNLPAAVSQAVSTEAAVLNDLSYGTEPLQRLDISLAKGRTVQTPVVIMIHGGGWTRGDKKDMLIFMNAFTSKGFSVASINHRLADRYNGTVKVDDMLSDVGQAVSYIHDHAEEWGIRRDKYIIWGVSSGSHLALLYSYSNAGNLIAAVMGFGTPTRFNDPVWDTEPYRRLAGQVMPLLTEKDWTSDTTNAMLAKASPYYSVAFKPTLLIHGDMDNTVPLSQSQQLYDLLQKNKIDSRLIILKNGRHGGQGASFQDIQAAMDVCVEWVKKYGS